MMSLTKALPANNTLQLQYFYSRSQVSAWSGPMFYFFQMDPASPYYPTASTSLTCIQGPSANCSLPVNLAGGGDAVWSDPNNNRYSGNLNTEQRALLTFSGNNGGWDYSTALNLSKNHNDNRNLGGYPNEYTSGIAGVGVLAPYNAAAGTNVLSDLINPFGPQSAAGQALINSSYVNGTYSAGDDKRWSFGGHATHPLGDVFNAGTPATVAIGFDLNGEHYNYATTAYNNLVQAATGFQPVRSRAVARYRRSTWKWTSRSPRASILIYRIVRTNTAISATLITARLRSNTRPIVTFPLGNRFHRLSGAHAQSTVLAEFRGGSDQRHHGSRKSGLPRGRRGHCSVYHIQLRYAGTGSVRRQQEPDARNIGEL